MGIAPPRQATNLIALDLLRFACALMVLSFHYGCGFALLPPPGGEALLDGMPVDRRWIPFVDSGWIGVELFFVISGYVIAISAEGATTAAFLRRRALRLLPAAWLCASVTALLLLAASDLPAATLGQRWLNSVGFAPIGTPIDPSYWTLAIEVNFYLAIAAVLTSGSDATRIERFGVALGSASLLYWLASLFFAMPDLGNRIMQLTLVPFGCFFALGMLLRRPRLAAAHRIFAVALVAACALAIEQHRSELDGQQNAYLYPLVPFVLGLLPILFARRLQPWLAGHIAPRLAATVGLMTYPLYLVHQELSAVIVGALLHLGIAFLPAAGLALIASLAFALAVVRFGEPPLRAMLKRLFGDGSARAMPLGEVAV